VSAETPPADAAVAHVRLPTIPVAVTARLPWLLVAALVVAWLGLTFKPVVENDGTYYFAYLRAIAVQHSLDFSSEYAAAIGEGVRYDPTLVARGARTGRPSNAYPVGPALLSLPIYLLAVMVAGPGGDQFAAPYSTAYCLASLLAGLLALALAFRLAVEVTGSTRAAAIGVAAAAATTPFAYYLSFEPSYSHTFSAFVATVFVWWWWRTRDGRTPLQWLVLGLLGGVMAMTRFQDGALVVVALVDVPAARWRALWLLPGAAAGFAPQLVVDAAQFGSPLPYRPAADSLRLLPGHYLNVLLSSDHGLLAWHPGIAAAAAGAILVRDRRLRLAFVVAAAVEVLIDGAAPDWDGGFALGGRRFLVLMPFFALGYAALAARIGPRLAACGLALLAAWNVVLMANLTYVIREKQDPGYGGLLIGQLRALPYVPRELAQGAAGRSIALWPLLHQSPRLSWGFGLLALEAGSVAVAAFVAVRGRRRGAARVDGLVQFETVTSVRR
jgi:hypothetical protein